MLCYYPSDLGYLNHIVVAYGNKNMKKQVINVKAAQGMKIALNQYGMWVNGISIKDACSVISELFARLKSSQQLYVGSLEGGVRSFQHYREISILHRLYSAEEMTLLTAL